MQAAHFRATRSAEIKGVLALALIGVLVLFAFAISPMGTVAAAIVAVVAYPLAGRDVSSSTALRGVQRASLAIATIGVGAAFLSF